VVGLEVVVEPQDVGTMRPPQGPSQKLIDEELEVCKLSPSGICRMFKNVVRSI
jgi:hypothetical protein